MIGVFSFLAGFWTFLSERVRINNISDRFMNGIIDLDKCDRGLNKASVSALDTKRYILHRWNRHDSLWPLRD